MAGAGGLWRGVSHVDPVQASIVSHDCDREPEELRSPRIRTIGSSFVWDCMAPALARSRLAGVQPAARRQPHTMLWVRACQTAMLRTLSRPRTTNPTFATDPRFQGFSRAAAEVSD